MSDGQEATHARAAFSLAPGEVASLEELFLVLRLSPDALLVINQDGEIVLVNEQAEALFGYARSSLRGQALEALLPPRFRALHIMHRDRFFATPRTRPMGAGLPLFGLRKDGSEFPVDISLRPLLIAGEPYVLGAIRDITQQRLAERERSQQAQLIRLQSALIEQAHDAILVRDPINRILSWNRGAERLYGWTKEEALGRITHALLATRFPAGRANIDAILEREGQWEGELLHTCRDGHSVLVESRQVLMRDESGAVLATLEVNRDITQRQRQAETEQAVHALTTQRLSFLQQVLNVLPSSVYLVYGPDARLLLANRATSRIWGATWALDQPMQMFLMENGIEISDAQGRPLSFDHLATIQAVQKEKALVQYQETIRRPDGSHLPVLVSVALLASHPILPTQAGHPIGVDERVALVVHQDVTALKDAEALKDEFVGIAAHELRTPVAVLSGYAEMLLLQTARGRGPQLAPWQQEALEEIKQATGRLSALTEDLLDVTRLQAGRLLLHPLPTNLVPLVQHVVSHLQRTTTRHQIVVQTSQPALVAAIDPQRVEQVMTNVIGNAIKYSPQGGPVMITLQAREAERALEISIQDHGIGIPRQQQGQIFGRFIRAENAQARGIGGTGLGLYLCRELVERQGGRLWFESEEGNGSTFFIRFPLVSPLQQECPTTS